MLDARDALNVELDHKIDRETPEEDAAALQAATLREVDAAIAARALLALPEPEWTTKLPDEPDRYYWMRSPDDARCVFVGFYCAGVEHMEFRIPQHNRDLVLTRAQAEFYGWEFLPVPLTPPPA